MKKYIFAFFCLLFLIVAAYIYFRHDDDKARNVLPKEVTSVSYTLFWGCPPAGGIGVFHKGAPP